MRKQSKRSRIFTVIIVIVLTVIFGLQLFIIYSQITPQQQQQAEDLQRIAELEQKIAELEYRLANTDDPEVIRRIAEELLGLVSPNEIIISGSHG